MDTKELKLITELNFKNGVVVTIKTVEKSRSWAGLERTFTHSVTGQDDEDVSVFMPLKLVFGEWENVMRKLHQKMVEEQSFIWTKLIENFPNLTQKDIEKC